MSIADNITRLKNETKALKVSLLAVSKTKSPEDIMEAYNAGQRRRPLRCPTHWRQLPDSSATTAIPAPRLQPRHLPMSDIPHARPVAAQTALDFDSTFSTYVFAVGRTAPIVAASLPSGSADTPVFGACVGSQPDCRSQSLGRAPRLA